MTKVDINIDGVNDNCLSCCDSLKQKLQLAKDKFKKVKLPFACDDLDQTNNDISKAISTISEFCDELRKAKDFCIKTESGVVSDIGNIDDFSI